MKVAVSPENQKTDLSELIKQMNFQEDNNDLGDFS